MANGEVAWQMYVLTVDNTCIGIHSSADGQYRSCWWFNDASVYLKEVFNVALFTDMLRIFQLAADFGKAVFRSCRMNTENKVMTHSVAGTATASTCTGDFSLISRGGNGLQSSAAQIAQALINLLNDEMKSIPDVLLCTIE